MMGEEAYARARKMGLKEYHGRMQRQENPFLPVLEEIEERMNALSHVPLGLMQIPLGAIVTNVYYQDDRFSYCVYGNMDGYILNSNLAWVSGGNGGDYAAADANYIGTARIVNCLSYASLRAYPDTRSTRLARVPLGSTVYNCSIVDDRFAYCEYNGQAGYILLDNLGW